MLAIMRQPFRKRNIRNHESKPRSTEEPTISGLDECGGNVEERDPATGYVAAEGFLDTDGRFVFQVSAGLSGAR
jgi:hypothetical protein